MDTIFILLLIKKIIMIFLNVPSFSVTTKIYLAVIRNNDPVVTWQLLSISTDNRYHGRRAKQICEIVRK